MNIHNYSDTCFGNFGNLVVGNERAWRNFPQLAYLFRYKSSKCLLEQINERKNEETNEQTNKQTFAYKSSIPASLIRVQMTWHCKGISKLHPESETKRVK